VDKSLIFVRVCVFGMIGRNEEVMRSKLIGEGRKAKRREEKRREEYLEWNWCVKE